VRFAGCATGVRSNALLGGLPKGTNLETPIARRPRGSSAVANRGRLRIDRSSAEPGQSLLAVAGVNGCTVFLGHAIEPRTPASSPDEGQSMQGTHEAPPNDVPLTTRPSSAPAPSRDFDDHGRSRSTNALRLVILLAVTGLVAALIAAGTFVQVTHLVTSAGH
jgi:hypothetical protein